MRVLIVGLLSVLLMACSQSDDTPAAAPEADQPAAQPDTSTAPAAQAAGVDTPLEAPSYVSFTVSGAGPDLVFIPGLASSAAVWDGSVNALADGHTVHVAQVAGFAGAPAAGETEALLDSILDDLIAHLEAQAPDGAVIVGHSMGGLLTLMLSHERPDLVEHAVIVDALPYYAVIIAGPAATPESMAGQAATFRDTLLNQDQATFEQSQRGALASIYLANHAHLDEVTQWSLDSDRATMAQAFYELMLEDMRPQLAAIEPPITVLAAWHPDMPFDQASSTAFWTGAYAANADAGVIMIPDAKHFIMFDQPEAFYEQINTVLAEQTG